MDGPSGRGHPEAANLLVASPCFRAPRQLLSGGRDGTRRLITVTGALHVERDPGRECLHFLCQSSSSGPLSPVTSTLSSATLTSPAPSRSSFMIGRTRCHLASSSSVGIRPVFLSGRGAISVVRMAYLVPAGSRTL